MKATRELLAVALLLAAGYAVSAQAAEELDEPVKLVRTLQVLQDQMAHGTLESEGARRTLIDAIGARLLAEGPQIWRDPRNVDAALLYVLSGGNPAVLGKLSGVAEAAERAPLIAAVRAYATGSEEAKALWTDIDIGTLPIALIGPSALAKATLFMKDDPKLAMRFVDMARLESPGTLIEEAAVRRGIEIAAKLGDAKRFEFFAIRYASRFPRSMYAEAFRHRFSEFYLAIASEKSSETAPSLETILAPLANDDRREIFLEIARVAVIGGKMTLGKSAAENAAALSAPRSVELQRAQLYRAAALAVGDDPAGARADLDAAGKGALPQRDRDLLAAALVVVDQVQRWPDVASGTEPPPVEKPGGPPQDGSAEPSVDVIARAHDAVQAAELLLADAGS